ncbi:MAG: heavy metal-binding domain-containing protein [Blautia sp.]|uniref:YbjQ family protein n=1 Tax=Blautia sp. TaxID=1955243 RepID=UPI002A75F309|nr:heavy metal-binding domain-containing protein [Blautia sp.]MDY3015915.1 heavy metal-binding domain-containing protein [Blautia sp.]
MLITTGYSFEKYDIINYLDVISASYVIGTGIFSSLESDLADLTGTRSVTYEFKLEAARKTVIKKLKERAAEIYADGIIGIDIDYTTFSNDVIGVIATGTAVILKPHEKSIIDTLFRIPVCSYNIKLPFNFSYIEFNHNIVNDSVYAALSLKNYSKEERILALNVDLELEDIFGELKRFNNIIFANDSESDIEYNKIEITKFTKMPFKDVRLDLTKKSYVYINKIMYSNEKLLEVSPCDTRKNDKISIEELLKIRKIQGADAITDAIINAGKWICYCGKLNDDSDEKCSRCEREKPIFKEYISAENVLYVLFNMKTAKEIYDYIIGINVVELNMILPNLLELVRKERLYGSMKEEAMKIVQNVFLES